MHQTEWRPPLHRDQQKGPTAWVISRAPVTDNKQRATMFISSEVIDPKLFNGMTYLDDFAALENNFKRIRSAACVADWKSMRLAPRSASQKQSACRWFNPGSGHHFFAIYTAAALDGRMDVGQLLFYRIAGKFSAYSLAQSIAIS